MDIDRFDAFARSIPLIGRRIALAGLSGAGVLALASQVAPNSAAKKRRKKRKKKCKKTPCPSTATAQCGGAVVDLATDPNNCGSCGNVCQAAVCVHGACACESGDDCAGSCICISREQGIAACSSSVFTEGTCATDSDCPLGAFCMNLQGELICSTPCP